MTASSSRPARIASSASVCEDVPIVSMSSRRSSRPMASERVYLSAMLHCPQLLPDDLGPLHHCLELFAGDPTGGHAEPAVRCNPQPLRIVVLEHFADTFRHDLRLFDGARFHVHDACRQK